MSLINDALRRKDQGQKTAAPQKADGAPMEAVQPAARSNASYLAPILITLIVLVLVMAGLLLWKGFQTQKQIVVTEKALVAPVQTAPVAPIAPVPAVVPAPAPVVAATPLTDPAVVVPTPATNPVVPPPPIEPPPLKLQGIFYRVSNPTAMINGKTLGIGESTAGTRVLKIERQHVTVERNGKQEVLTLE